MHFTVLCGGTQAGNCTRHQADVSVLCCPQARLGNPQDRQHVSRLSARMWTSTLCAQTPLVLDTPDLGHHMHRQTAQLFRNAAQKRSGVTALDRRDNHPGETTQQSSQGKGGRRSALPVAPACTTAVPSSLICTVVPAAAAAASSSSLLLLGMVLQYTLDCVLRREKASAPVALTCRGHQDKLDTHRACWHAGWHPDLLLGHQAV